MRDKSTWVFATLLVASLGIFLFRTSVPAEGRKTEAQRLVQDDYVENWREVQQVSVSSKPEAEVQLIEFVDYECPICGQFQTALDTLQQKYEIGVTVLQYPLSIHRFANRLANMAECARFEGRFQEMNNLLYARLDSIGMKPWREYGQAAGVTNVDKWLTCMETNGSQAVIDLHLTKVKELNVQGTPTVIVNGRLMTNAPTVKNISAVIDSVLQGKPFIERR